MQVKYSGDSPHHTPITLRLLGAKLLFMRRRPLFRVVEDVTYTVPEAHPALRTFVIPGVGAVEPYEYDRATMPLFTRAFIDRDLLDSAALGHDYALDVILKNAPEGTLTRKDCDELFLVVAMGTNHLRPWEARLAYAAVRANSIWQGIKDAVGLEADS